MHQNVIVIQDEKSPLIGDNLIFLHLLPKEKNSEKRMIFVSFLLPYPHAPEMKFSEKRFRNRFGHYGPHKN
jgi:hypothetical protein